MCFSLSSVHVFFGKEQDCLLTSLLFFSGCTLSDCGMVFLGAETRFRIKSSVFCTKDFTAISTVFQLITGPTACLSLPFISSQPH